ncbi:hypothetical protein G6O67_002581 [Ophiocordyceps sinensis]|uniref:Uncharacterized protein n=1 Tax=Ophiocordyceps sinensis TaxID=72228 RepID=A0A8H4V7F6_9HYPO|nr:hypothetical protein G6O67_002581 [Ophiocordyceps sinensis]
MHVLPCMFCVRQFFIVPAPGNNRNKAVEKSQSRRRRRDEPRIVAHILIKARWQQYFPPSPSFLASLIPAALDAGQHTRVAPSMTAHRTCGASFAMLSDFWGLRG